MRARGRSLTLAGLVCGAGYVVFPDTLVLLAASGLVVVGVPMWIAGTRIDETHGANPHDWSRRAKLIYGAELGVFGLYTIGSSLAILFAAGWHATGVRVVILLVLVVAYFVGGTVVLAWSLTRWRRGERSAFYLPLLIPIASVAVPPLLNLALVVFDLRDGPIG
jgi:hypothetical protein